MGSSLGRIAAGPRSRKAVIAIAVTAMFAIPVAVFASDTFTDVPDGPSTFLITQHDAVNALVAAGITGGCKTSPPKYCPNDAVTRGQMAIFMSRLGNLQGDRLPVVDARTLFGQIIIGFEEPFDLTGGSPTECVADTADPFVFGEYTVQNQLIDIAENQGEPVVDEGEVFVSIKDDPTGNDSDYQVCFHRDEGNLSAGTYDTYGTGFLFVGAGVTSASAEARVSQFRSAKAAKAAKAG